MTEHTKTDGLPGMDNPAPDPAGGRAERAGTPKIACNACPVLCQISEGRSGACDRYANQAGTLVRVDPVILLHRSLSTPDAMLVPFAPRPAADNTDAAGHAAEAGWPDDLMLRNEEKPCLPAKLEIVDALTARLTITEGRYHQVRRMFASQGWKVEALHRERVGEYTLEGIAEGEWLVVEVPGV